MAITSRNTWSEGVRANATWLSVVFFYAVLANVPYWVASGEFGLSNQGSFCVQYATVGLIALAVPASLSATLLFAVIFADILCGVCASYCIPARECLENLRAANSFSGVRLAYAISVLLLTLLTVMTAAFLPIRSLARKQKSGVAASLVMFAVTALCADAFSLHIADNYLPRSSRPKPNPDQLDVRGFYTFRLARIPVVRLVRLEEIDAANRGKAAAAKGVPSPVPSAAGAAIQVAGVFSSDDKRELPNLVLILVESWGLVHDAPLKEALIQPYTEPNLSPAIKCSRGPLRFMERRSPAKPASCVAARSASTSSKHRRRI
ncbi:MAG: hypothetical protein ABSF23_07885 [Terracidiphilus sp.]